VGNPLLLFWYRLFATEPVRRPPRWRVPMSTSRKASATIFLVMRRMRAPLIV
jgi:voltage-gated potassium channel